MGIKNKKTRKKIDLLKMPDSEKIKVLMELKQSLRQKVVEAKLWQSFIEAENLTINGEAIHCKDTDLKGFSLNELVKSI